MSASSCTPREKYSFSTLSEKCVAGALVGGNVVQRLLEREPVQRLRAVGVEAVQNVGEPFFAGRASADRRCASPLPITVTVGLVVSVRTIRRMPLGSVVSETAM